MNSLPPDLRVRHSTTRSTSRASLLGALVVVGLASASLLGMPACGGENISVGADKAAQTSDDGGGGGDSTSPTGPTCTTDTDCGPAGSGKLCGYDQKLACTATGHCFDVGLGATCAAYSPGCACDNTEINVACSPLPSGYLSKPLLHAGSCGGTGAQDAAAPCSSDMDCGTGYSCGFPKSEGCAAKGVCLYTAGMATCAAYSPGCACDGTPINVACTGLPDGYEHKPLAHAGACTDGGP